MIHCGFVGLIGLPNSGKSTLLNHLISENVTIVSEKPQTTRRALTGVLTTDRFQLIFYDAPGLVPPKKGLFDFLAAEVERVIELSDRLLVVVANDQKDNQAMTALLSAVEKSAKPPHYLFSKADLPQSEYVGQLKSKLTEQGTAFVEISVNQKKTAGIPDLLEQIAKSLPQEAHPLYDPDIISLEKTRDIVAEFIREQCFVELSQEVPFGLAVSLRSYKRQKGLLRIEADIIVEKENHKAIVIGKKGSLLKKIGQQSRVKIEQLLGEKIYLGLHVSFKKNWLKNKAIMKDLGYHHGRQ